MSTQNLCISSAIMRPAQLADIPEITALIERSARELSKDDYSQEQLDWALKGTLGVDTQLINDQSYFVIEYHKSIIACGGWSFRHTLFGGDDKQARNPQRLEPRTEPAKIRAFFVCPNHARKGLGTWLLKTCEQAALKHGFNQVELMATLPGARLYQKYGYIAQKPLNYALTNYLSIQFIPMLKSLL